MKIEIKEKKESFKPITISLKIETKEELDSFKAMSQMSTGVSELVERTSLVKSNNNILFKKSVLKNILDKIFHHTKWSEDI